MNDTVIWMLAGTILSVVVVMQVIYRSIVFPYLKSKGIHTAHVLFMEANMVSYRSARLSAGEPLTWWYAHRVLQILWVVLLFLGVYLNWRGQPNKLNEAMDSTRQRTERLTQR